MSKKTVSAAELGRKLGNSKMTGLVARMFGKERLSVSDNGLLELSEDEEDKIRATYGEGFLKKLKAVDFSSASEADADTLFKEAVKFKAEELTKDKDAVITQLRADIDALVREPEPAPAAQTLAQQAGIAVAKAVNMAASHYRLVSAALASANPMDFSRLADSGLDVTDINAEFGKVMPPRTRLDIFTRNIYLGIPDAPLFTREQSNTDYKAAESLMTEVSQAFTPYWSPKGKASFRPITIPYRRHKVNVTFKPADIIKSWLTFLYEQGKTPAEQPVTRYIVEQLIMPKVQDDVTRIMLGKGKYAEPTSVTKDGDVGTSAVSSMDGIETILVEDKAAATRKFNHFKAVKNPFTLTGQDLLDYVASFVKAISKYFVNKPLIYCSEEFLEHYQAQDFAVNGKYTGQGVGNAIRFSGFSFQPMKCMYGSPILFSTPKSNLVMLVDYASASNCVNKIEEHHYDVDVMGEYSLSVGFQIADAVFAAVPDSYTPATSVIGNSPEAGDSEWDTGAKTATQGGDESGKETGA